MPDLTAYEIGEDGGRWLVVGQAEVHRETINVAEARLAVLALLREQLMPGNEDQFASEVLDVLDAPARVHEYPIYSDAETELVYARSPIGGTPIWGDRLGTCAVALGFALPDHRSVRRDIEKRQPSGPSDDEIRAARYREQMGDLTDPDDEAIAHTRLSSEPSDPSSEVVDRG